MREISGAGRMKDITAVQFCTTHKVTKNESCARAALVKNTLYNQLRLWLIRIPPYIDCPSIVFHVPVV